MLSDLACVKRKMRKRKREGDVVETTQEDRRELHMQCKAGW